VYGHAPRPSPPVFPPRGFPPGIVFGGSKMELGVRLARKAGFFFCLTVPTPNDPVFAIGPFCPHHIKKKSPSGGRPKARGRTPGASPTFDGSLRKSRVGVFPPCLSGNPLVI